MGSCPSRTMSTLPAEKWRFCLRLREIWSWTVRASNPSSSATTATSATALRVVYGPEFGKRMLKETGCVICLSRSFRSAAILLVSNRAFGLIRWLDRTSIQHENRSVQYNYRASLIPCKSRCGTSPDHSIRSACRGEELPSRRRATAYGATTLKPGHPPPGKRSGRSSLRSDEPLGRVDGSGQGLLGRVKAYPCPFGVGGAPHSAHRSGPGG